MKDAIYIAILAAALFLWPALSQQLDRWSEPPKVQVVKRVQV